MDGIRVVHSFLNKDPELCHDPKYRLQRAGEANTRYNKVTGYLKVVLVHTYCGLQSKGPPLCIEVRDFRVVLKKDSASLIHGQLSC